MREEKCFDGVILPVPYRRINIGCNGRGAVMGVTMNTLETAPEDIKINIATPKIEALNQFDLFWLEDCPRGNGHWGKTACYYWLLKEFSTLADLGRNAIRVRSAEGVEARVGSEEFIFWQDGKPVPIGRQYFVGRDIACRLLRESPYDHFGHLIEKWREEDYDLWKMSIGDLRGKTDSILGDFPRMKIVKAERALSIDSRNAGWDSQYPLVEEFV